MKYILVKNNDIILYISDSLEINEKTGYYICENERQCMINPNIVDKIYEVDNVPSDVRVQTHCYNEEDGFYKNPNTGYYTIEERISSAEDSITEIELALTEIYEGGLTNG